MKKQLLLMAMAVFSLSTGYAQEEGGEEEPTPEIVYTKSFQTSINDAKSIVASSHYTTGQTALQAAINDAETVLSTLETNAAVIDAMKALQSAINSFVEANGHADATDKVLNNSFDKDADKSKTITSWTVQNFKQNRRSVSYATTRGGYAISNFAEQWVNSANGSLAGSGNMSQVVTGLPV